MIGTASRSFRDFTHARLLLDKISATHSGHAPEQAELEALLGSPGRRVLMTA